MRLRSLLLVLLAVAAVPAMAGGPKRGAALIAPRAEATISPIPKFSSSAARLEQIRGVLARQDEAIAKLKPPVMVCRRVPDGTITIDGKPNEAAWKRADVATNFKETRNLAPCKAKTACRLLWDSKHLYVAFECEDSDVIGTIAERDGDYWREDTVEVFIDPNADGMDYLEFEVSPRGLLYDGAIADYRPEVDWLKDITHLDINKSRDLYDTATPLAVHVDGTLNNSADKDRGWTCEIAFTWAEIARGTPVAAGAPQDGDLWRIGLYHINNKAYKDPKFAQYGAWSPTTTWFHAPRLFGRVVFTTSEK